MSEVSTRKKGMLFPNLNLNFFVSNLLLNFRGLELVGQLSFGFLEEKERKARF